MTCVVAAISMAAVAQSNAPVFTMMPNAYARISDNGKWAIAQQGAVEDGTLAPSGGTIINLATKEEQNISHSSGLSGVADITNDGNLVVGECLSKPAYWSREKGEWTVLSIPSGYASGRLNAVTPDGRYAAGYIIPSDFNWGASPIMYDLTTNQQIELPNLPKLDMTHLDQRQNCIYTMSPDGRYLVCQMSESYILPPSLCTYVYDRQTATYNFIGFTPDDTKDWTPLADNLFFVEGPVMSPNGKWVTGMAYIIEPVAGSEYGNEYRATFRYNVETQEFKVFDAAGENDISGSNVLSDGTVLGATPATSPYPSTMVRSGNYYVGLDEILKQVYNIDFETATGIQNTGYAAAVSDDGMTLLMQYDPEKTYLLQLKEPLAEAAAKVNLLGHCTVTPGSGTSMSQLGEIRIAFDRNVETNGVYSKITCKSEDGQESWTPLQQGGWVAEGKNAIITFRTRQLRKDVKYTLTIPAGMVRIAGDRNVTSPAIEITFTGRGADAVQMTQCYPEDGAAVAGLDITNNPMVITFDADIKLVGTPVAKLWRVGENEPYCDLNILAANNQILLYPTSGQHLFKDTDYKIVIPAGAVTDLSGAGANGEMTINYHGAYVRTISADDKYLFHTECSDYESLIFYDGDQLAPGTIPASWGFQASVPWMLVRTSTESSDQCMGAHSMFADSGTSDDWMSTPQIYIPDEDCFLKFDAQSYKKDKTDRLKVYVYESGNVYNSFNKSIIDAIRAEGKLVFDEQLTPGASEEGLEGDWKNFTVSLKEFAGKDVYIAFLNENTDQSAVFVDNIAVIHDMRFLVSFQNDSRVVDKDGIDIKGTVTVASETETFDEISMVLRDGDGKEVDKIHESGLNLVKDAVYNFSFSKQLPLTVGTVNKYSVEVTMNGRSSSVLGEIRNLSFEPEKKIVLEEYSGARCGNCPQGFIAIDNIEALYPGKLLTICTRTYSGDPLASGMGSYTAFLGLQGAPSARMNRGDIIYPMVSNSGDYMLSGAGLVDSETGLPLVTWLDEFQKLVVEPADAEISFTSAYDEPSNNININWSMRNALNLSDAAINVFAVVTENNLETFQDNYMANVDDPDLGKWGKGGDYGQSRIYPFTINDVTRGAYGTTFNGTGGLIPANLTAGQAYTGTLSFQLPSAVTAVGNCDVTLMLIDASTGKVLNSARGSVTGGSGIGEIVAENAAPAIVRGEDAVLVRAQGAPVSAQAYSLTGQLLASGSSDDLLTLDLNGYTGIVIVKAVAKGGKAATAKFLVK